jgi:hypothetical protein
MLTINGHKCHSTCDGVGRREFIKVGALGFAGLTLPDLLRDEAQDGVASSNKAVINIHLGGGPSHQDMFDLKPDAPVEFRGEFNPIKTNVPGMEICELMPKLATMADKFAIVRSLVGSSAGHSSFQTHTRFNKKSLTNVGGRPSIGAVVSKMQGASESGAPPWVSYNEGPVGFLGPTYKPYKPGRAGNSLRLQSGMTAERMQGRTSLLSQLDGIRRDLDSTDQMAAMDSYTQRAYSMVTSGTVADALDLKKEDPQVYQQYGKANESLLRARRLIQAGVRAITMNASWGGWDTHNDNFTKLRKSLPLVDHGISTLISDLTRLEMIDDVTIVMWGEFGRTPRVNKKAGRDHWPKVSMCFLAGGGMRTGQVIGATDRTAAEAKDRPLHFQEVLATVYHNLGINPRNTTFIDHNGRPQYLLEHRDPIRELI